MNDLILSTAEQPSPFDPLDRMPPDEPRFVIRGSDPAGPNAITEWARVRRNLAFKQYGPDATGDARRLLEADLVQCKEAEELALLWREIQQGHEVPDEQRATYAGLELTEEQIAASRRQKNQAELLRHLRDADFYASELFGAEGAPEMAQLHELSVTAAEWVK